MPKQAMANYDDEELHEAAFFLLLPPFVALHGNICNTFQSVRGSQSVIQSASSVRLAHFPSTHLPISLACLPGIVWLRRRCQSVYLSVLATAYTAC